MAKDDNKEVEKNKSNVLKSGNGWLYGALAVVAALLVFGFGMAVSRHGEFGNDDTLKNPHLVRMARPMGGGMMGVRGNYGGTVTVNGQTRTDGVVTSVNGNIFTIAGHGSTTNVTAGSSTQYRGGNQVKQNDTVVVFGTTSSNTLAATQIVINP